MYIIVWRNNHRGPFVDTDSRHFLESYPTYEDAKSAAEEIMKNENEREQSPWYFDYKIYEEK
jgi:hypothetical protein